MPLHRRLPKRGFHNPFRKEFEVVNLASLSIFDADATVDPVALRKVGLVRRGALPVKILAKGKLDRKLTVKAHAFSDAARAAIEAQGGEVEVLA